MTKLFPSSIVQQGGKTEKPNRVYTWQWFDLQGRIIDFGALMARQKKSSRPQRRQRSMRP